MTTQNYGQTQSLATQNELTDLLQRLVKSRSYYSEILSQAIGVGHRLHDTNAPETTGMGKEAPMDARGLITDLKKEIERIDQLNHQFEGLVNKLNSLV